MRFVLLGLLVLSLLVGCNQTPQNEASPPPDNQNNQGVRAQQTVPEKPLIQNKQEVRDRLEQLAESIPQVNNANCVILGNTAIVGINVAPELDRSRVDVIKYSVAEAFRKDPYGIHAFVTADMDIAGRIQEIRDDINRGRPVAGFVEELADIIGRIVPQIPKTITQQNNQPAESEDTQKLQQKEM